MIAIEFPNLLRRQVGCYMCKISMSQIISAMDDVLKYILHVAEMSGRNTLTAYFIKGLAAIDYVTFNSHITIFDIIPCNYTHVRNPESVRQTVSPHQPRIILLPVTDRFSNSSAIFPNYLKHSGFPRSDVPEQP